MLLASNCPYLNSTPLEFRQGRREGYPEDTRVLVPRVVQPLGIVMAHTQSPAVLEPAKVTLPGLSQKEAEVLRWGGAGPGHSRSETGWV